MPRQATPIENALIRQSHLKTLRRGDAIEKAARRRARQIVDAAQAEAETLQSHGWQAGYQAGMLRALDQVAAQLGDYQSQAARWQARLSAEARDMLTAAVNHPDTLLLLLDEWLQSRNGSAQEQVLHLLLPRRAKGRQAELMALLSDNWHGAIQIDYHDDERFIMRCADQAAEFSPEQFVGPASLHLRQRLHTLSRDCAGLSAAALRQFHLQLEARLQTLSQAAGVDQQESESC
ncbi:hypothetical protein [Chromobacterium sp. IIBBL 290-4]|uniref:hypothetical protein n=1 Tax=Chromobacterium sp. IIBBL 290-4 TaxID=2953890 RepID=UPI0020B67E82|nr:hypothetical protein [Chromobacterium sp. IIBBL 290-4]UTH74119.1 hypothetical protein NKT35_21665 [Chromobacterium sp. IIBBL 290-4]